MGFGSGFGSDFGMGGGFGAFEILPIWVMLIFAVVFIGILVILVKGIVQWNKNNHSPRLTVPVVVVAKRTDVDVSHHHGAGDHHHSHTSTSYYVTFQLGSGDRMELHVPGTEYGLLVEGDKGNLSFQGTRYLGFERE